MTPARKGDGAGLSFNGYSQVRKGDGTVLWNAIPDSGLSHQWDTDEGSGTTLTDVNGALDGTINGATWTTGAGTGDVHLNYDGTDDHTDLGLDSRSALSFAISDTGSFGFWIRPDTITNDDNQNQIIGNFLASGDNTFSFRLKSAGELDYTMTDGGGNFDGVTGSALSTGAWTFVGVRMDGSTRYLYINDVQDASATITYTGTGDLTRNDVIIGAWDDGADGHFDGGIDIAFAGPTDIGDQGMKDWYSDTQQFYP